MAIQDEMTQQLKTAMRNKDKKMLNLVRMLKTKMTEKTTAPGFSGEVDDALWLGVTYAKSRKSTQHLRDHRGGHRASC